MADATFWNGEPAGAERVKVLIPRHSWPKWLDADASPLRHAVRVRYGRQAFFIDNEDGSGWRKVTNGFGSPQYGHRSLPIGCAVSSGDSGWVPLTDADQETQ